MTDARRTDTRVDPRRWFLPMGVVTGGLVAAFFLGGQWIASREAIDRLSKVPTEEGVKLSITEALRPLEVSLIEMRVETRVQNEATTAQIKALAERVTKLEDKNN